MRAPDLVSPSCHAAGAAVGWPVGPERPPGAARPYVPARVGNHPDTRRAASARSRRARSTAVAGSTTAKATRSPGASWPSRGRSTDGHAGDDRVAADRGVVGQEDDRAAVGRHLDGAGHHRGRGRAPARPCTAGAVHRGRAGRRCGPRPAPTTQVVPTRPAASPWGPGTTRSSDGAGGPVRPVAGGRAAGRVRPGPAGRRPAGARRRARSGRPRSGIRGAAAWRARRPRRGRHARPRPREPIHGPPGRPPPAGRCRRGPGGRRRTPTAPARDRPRPGARRRPPGASGPTAVHSSAAGGGVVAEQQVDERRRPRGRRRRRPAPRDGPCPGRPPSWTVVASPGSSTSRHGPSGREESRPPDGRSARRSVPRWSAASTKRTRSPGRDPGVGRHLGVEEDLDGAAEQVPAPGVARG